MKDRKILVPLDASPLSAQTVKGLLAQKENLAAPLTLLHVLDFSRLSYRGFAEKSFAEIEAQAREKAREFLAARQSEFTAAGIETQILLKEGHARETICELADSGEYDLLVLGKHVDSDLRKLLFGQVANYLVHHVKCPVLIV
jgi:nucleotide-binding universal stress UspA family protein